MLPQEFNAFDLLTVKENIRYFGGMVDKSIDAKKLINAVDLQDKRDEYFKNLSGGLKQRVGVAMYGMHVTLGAVSMIIITAASVMFTSMGLIIARFVKDEETAGAAAGAITFPMMFLAGSFFRLEMMPYYLQAISRALPLTYVNNGLRNSMIYGNTEAAFGNLLIVLVLAVILAAVGVLISTWKQD